MTQRRSSIKSSAPIITPATRTSLMIGYLLFISKSRVRKTPSSVLAWSSRFSCSIISRRRYRLTLQSDCRQVAACMPGLRLLAISGLASNASASDTAAERLGQRDHVGLDVEALVTEPFARPAATRLDFVEHKQAGRDRHKALRRPARNSADGDADATFALNGLDHDRARFFVDQFGHGIQVAVRSIRGSRGGIGHHARGTSGWPSLRAPNVRP